MTRSRGILRLTAMCSGLLSMAGCWGATSMPGGMVTMGSTVKGQGSGFGQCSALPAEEQVLVHEWNERHRHQLAERLGMGATLVVRATTCGVEVLRSCFAEGGYAYEAEPSPREQTAKSVTDEPVPLTVAGAFEATSKGVSEADLVGECEGATHVLVRADVGRVSSSGADEACRSTASDTPLDGCGLPVVIWLVELARAAECEGASCGEGLPPDPQPEPSPGKVNSPPPPVSPRPQPLSCNPDDVLCN